MTNRVGLKILEKGLMKLERFLPIGFDLNRHRQNK
jgi:hypothetical protein